jgi:hypothetical protein
MHVLKRIEAGECECNSSGDLCKPGQTQPTQKENHSQEHEGIAENELRGERCTERERLVKSPMQRVHHPHLPLTMEIEAAVDAGDPEEAGVLREALGIEVTQGQVIPPQIIVDVKGSSKERPCQENAKRSG